jgi:hypothetical protein
LKQKIKIFLTDKNINSLDELVKHIEELKASKELDIFHRQMLMDLVYLVVNGKSVLNSYFAETKFLQNKNPSREFYNAFKKDSENEEKVKTQDQIVKETCDKLNKVFGFEIAKPVKDYTDEEIKSSPTFMDKVINDLQEKEDKVRANLVKGEGSNSYIVVLDFSNLNEAKKYFRNSSFTEAFYYKYGTKKLIEEETKILKKEDVTDVVKEDYSVFYSTPNKNIETRTEEPNFMPGWGYFPKRAKIITYNNLTSCKDVNKTAEIKAGKKESQTVKKAPIFTFCKQMKNAIEEMAFRTEYGHNKYIEFDADYNNFARVDNGDEEYGNAQFRHALGIGEDSELEHYVASAWDAVARLEIYLRNSKS